MPDTTAAAVVAAVVCRLSVALECQAAVCFSLGDSLFLIVTLSRFCCLLHRWQRTASFHVAVVWLQTMLNVLIVRTKMTTGSKTKLSLACTLNDENVR